MNYIDTISVRHSRSNAWMIPSLCSPTTHKAWCAPLTHIQISNVVSWYNFVSDHSTDFFSSWPLRQTIWYKTVNDERSYKLRINRLRLMVVTASGILYAGCIPSVFIAIIHNQINMIQNVFLLNAPGIHLRDVVLLSRIQAHSHQTRWTSHSGLSPEWAIQKFNIRSWDKWQSIPGVASSHSALHSSGTFL